MASKNPRKTRSKIVTAAWKLFYEQGYDNTTIEEIIEESGTSRGSFYHYFDGKDALLGSLSEMFDEKYEELIGEVSDDRNRFELLLYLNKELFRMIEGSIDFDLLCRLYATQLTTRGERHLQDRNRTYYRLLRKIMTEGQQRGELTSTMSVNEMVHYYAMCERGIIYDWCLGNADYPLTEFTAENMPKMLYRLLP